MKNDEHMFIIVYKNGLKKTITNIIFDLFREKSAVSPTYGFDKVHCSKHLRVYFAEIML